MLIRNNNTIKMMPDPGKKGYYTYITKKVYDATATQKAREACYTQWNGKIAELNDLLTECRTHINQIKKLQAEVNEKMTTLDTLTSQFNDVQGYVDKAKIDFDIEDGNKNCMAVIMGELSSMATNCTEQLEEWQEKQTDAKLAKKDAMLEKKNCALITKYKTVTEKVWVQ